MAAWGIGSNNAVFTSGGSYNYFTSHQVSTSGGRTLGAEYLVLTATGTQHATGTSSASGAWSGAIVTYKGA